MKNFFKAFLNKASEYFLASFVIIFWMAIPEVIAITVLRNFMLRDGIDIPFAVLVLQGLIGIAIWWWQLRPVWKNEKVRELTFQSLLFFALTYAFAGWAETMDGLEKDGASCVAAIFMALSFYWLLCLAKDCWKKARAFAGKRPYESFLPEKAEQVFTRRKAWLETCRSVWRKLVPKP